KCSRPCLRRPENLAADELSLHPGLLVLFPSNFPLRPLPGGRRSRLGRAFRTAPITRQTESNRVWHAPRLHSRPATLPRGSVRLFLRSVLFCPAAAPVKDKTKPETAEREKP